MIFSLMLKIGFGANDDKQGVTVLEDLYVEEPSHSTQIAKASVLPL